VKWLGEHKFLLKAEKGWFLPVLWKLACRVNS
jgi:hypothetical protein